MSNSADGKWKKLLVTPEEVLEEARYHCDGGEVTLRDPKSKEGAKQHVEPTGEPLSLEIKKAFTEEMCRAFFYTRQNYHNDKEASKELDVIVTESQRLSRLIGNILTFSRKSRLSPQ